MHAHASPALETAVIVELKECGKTKDLRRGRLLHSNAIQSGCHKNTYVATTLISMYSKCGRMEDARDVFDSMLQRTTVSWNALILGYVENGQNSAALEVFQRMNCPPNRATFVAALKACNKVENGVSVHKQAREFGLHRDVFVANTLVEMYSRCGEMSEARRVFEGMLERDAVSWTVLIMGYVENGQSSMGLDVFYSMDCTPDRVTFLAVIKACVKNSCLQKGKAIHRQARGLGFERDVVVAIALVDMYSKCGDMLHARDVFERMVHRDVVAWTALIVGYVENGQSLVALDVFQSMDCAPDRVTFVAALKACAGLAEKEKGASIHRQAEELGFDKDVVVASILVDMYSKCGEMVQAHRVFDGMRYRDVVTWTALIAGYVENGQCSVALDVFRNMDCTPDSVTFVAALKACAGLEKDVAVSVHKQARELGFDNDLVVANTLVDMYSKCGDMLYARGVFEGMTHRSVVSWTALIIGYVENGQSSVALDLFDSMDCVPNALTFSAVLKACASLGALELGQGVHYRVCELGVEDQAVANSLVDFYGKCGSMNAAEGVFNSMHSQDIVSWNSLVGGYSSLGDVRQVFKTVERMQESGVEMDCVTMQLLLTACNHSGVLKEGVMYFESMLKYGVKTSVEHYTCMVDMLGRANKLEEALLLVRGMPFVADSVVLTALLAACIRWRNVGVGQVAFNALVALNEDEGSVAAAYVLMRNMYEAEKNGL